MDIFRSILDFTYDNIIDFSVDGDNLLILTNVSSESSVDFFIKIINKEKEVFSEKVSSIPNVIYVKGNFFSLVFGDLIKIYEFKEGIWSSSKSYNSIFGTIKNFFIINDKLSVIFSDRLYLWDFNTVLDIKNSTGVSCFADKVFSYNKGYLEIYDTKNNFFKFLNSIYINQLYTDPILQSSDRFVVILGDNVHATSVEYMDENGILPLLVKKDLEFITNTRTNIFEDFIVYSFMKKVQFYDIKKNEVVYSIDTDYSNNFPVLTSNTLYIFSQNNSRRILNAYSLSIFGNKKRALDSQLPESEISRLVEFYYNKVLRFFVFGTGKNCTKNAIVKNGNLCIRGVNYNLANDQRVQRGLEGFYISDDGSNIRYSLDDLFNTIQMFDQYNCNEKFKGQTIVLVGLMFMVIIAYIFIFVYKYYGRKMRVSRC